MAGGTTAYSSKLKKMHAEMDSSHKKKVYFFDNFHKKEKALFYQMADIFISLSDYESFGIVFAEALIHGLPIIASCFGVAGSIVDNFKTGLLVNPYCEDEVAGAIMELLLDDEIRKRYGEKGREIVLNQYDPLTILAGWEKFLTTLL
ncbi:MAG TPA: glycosyltransferase [Candidatus Aminicenantes bacterium]|nr:glycosyltransferase [Candidatus Aminicenantes bacterium]